MVSSRWYRRISSYMVTATMATFGVTGIAGAQTITNTGPGSHNNITDNVTNNCRVTNTNDVHVYNTNRQTATTGDVNVSGNTTAGVSWAGWSGMDPTAAQAGGTAYASWWSGVVNWIAQRASGDGWNSSNTNLSWMPGGSSWAGYDPMAWQANGQSFGNWYNAVESYLNANNGVWVLGWPADATGAANFGGAMSGNATNNYNANFSININNAARAAAGTDSCGHSLFTPPAGNGGGSGGGGAVLGASTSAAARALGGSGGFGGFGGYSSYAPASRPVSAPVVATTPAPVVTPPAAGGSGGGGVPTPASSISNTGPGSSNNITSNTTDNSQVTNRNNVTVVNYSTQTATSGSANDSGNTTTGSGGSGSATNNNGTGADVGLSN